MVRNSVMKGSAATIPGVKSDINEFAQPAKKSLSQAVKSILSNKNFVKWFGDSKVVDENGEPLVVYHGVKKGDKFTIFQEWVGSFFTPNKEYASGYTGEGKKSVIMPVYLSIKNPMDTRTDEKARAFYNNEFIPFAKNTYKSLDDGRYVPLKRAKLYHSLPLIGCGHL